MLDTAHHLKQKLLKKRKKKLLTNDADLYIIGFALVAKD